MLGAEFRTSFGRRGAKGRVEGEAADGDSTCTMALSRRHVSWRAPVETCMARRKFQETM